MRGKRVRGSEERTRESEEGVRPGARVKVRARMNRDYARTLIRYRPWGSMVDVGASWRAKADRLRSGGRARSSGPAVSRVSHSSKVEASPTIRQQVPDVLPRLVCTAGLLAVWRR